MTNKKLYEKYHKYIKLQRNIIKEDNFTYRNTLTIIQKYIPQNGKVLDIGSATGTISFYLGSRGLNVIGIEPSKNAVKYSRLNNRIFLLKNVNFLNMQLEMYKSKLKFDLITCFEVLEHLEDDMKCLRIIVEHMNSNSVLVITVPSTNAPLYKLGLLRTFDKEVGHLRRYSINTISSKVNNAGLRVKKVFKTEGIIRSLLFTNNLLGKLIRFTRFTFINNFVNYIDSFTISIFKESQLILICKKK